MTKVLLGWLYSSQHQNVSSKYLSQDLSRKIVFINFCPFFFFLQLDVDGQIDSVHLFMSPRQVHLLLDMVAAIAGPGK